MGSYSADLYDIVLDYIFRHEVNTVPRRAHLECTFILNLPEVTVLENSTLSNMMGAGCKTVKTVMFSIWSSLFFFFSYFNIVSLLWQQLTAI